MTVKCEDSVPNDPNLTSSTYSKIPSQNSDQIFKQNNVNNIDNNNYNNNNEQIYINQPNSMYIVAKYGQTISLPCIINRVKNQDLVNVHAIWHKLSERQRPTVLSVGLQQLKQDMRYRVKVVNSNNMKKSSLLASTASSFNSNSETNNLINQSIESLTQNSEKSQQADSIRNKYLIQNWSFEIRKLAYEDSGTYQCLLPLVKPITKNITLQVIRNFKFDI
jgi:hypothetical protein